MNKFIYNLISGILIGTCMILPGVSGSVMAIMLGVYEEVIALIGSRESNIFIIKKIFPIAFGILIGIFIFGRILLFFYNKYTFYMIYIFIGLLIASIPVLKTELDKKNEKVYINILLISLFISLLLFLIPKIIDLKVSSNLTFLNMFLGGFFYISGKIIPGISSSFFLMLFGLYNYILKIIINPFGITFNTVINLLPFLLGVIIGFIFFIKIINFLLKKYYPQTYSGIIGFIIGSIVAIFPGIDLNINTLYALVLSCLSFELVNILSKKG